MWQALTIRAIVTHKWKLNERRTVIKLVIYLQDNHCWPSLITDWVTYSLFNETMRYLQIGLLVLMASRCKTWHNYTMVQQFPKEARVNKTIEEYFFPLLLSWLFNNFMSRHEEAVNWPLREKENWLAFNYREQYHSVLLSRFMDLFMWNHQRCQKVHIWKLDSWNTDK